MFNTLTSLMFVIIQSELETVLSDRRRFSYLGMKSKPCVGPYISKSGLKFCLTLYYIAMTDFFFLFFPSCLLVQCLVDPQFLVGCSGGCFPRKPEKHQKENNV